MSAARLGGAIAWGIIAFLSVGVGGYALYHAATGFEAVPQAVMQNPYFQPVGLQTHIAASGVAMLVGAFQFHRGLRRRAPTLHRWLGRIYVAACVIGGISGGMIALGSTSGPVAGWGFFVLAVLWVPFTLLALFSAMRKDFAAHERWMIRSFALTFGAVTLRLYLPIGLLTVGFDESYPLIAWLAWVPNLIVAEIFIATLRKPKRPKVAPGAAPA